MNLFLSALMIFVLRLIDQALTTIRGLVVSKKPFLGAFIGLVESAIWIIVVSKVINDIDEPVLIFGYALGFAAGTVLGSYIERFIGIGSTVVRVFSSANSPSVAKALRDEAAFEGEYPTMNDGVRGMLFIEKVVESHKKGNVWQSMENE